MKSALLRITTVLVVIGLLFSVLGVQTARAATTLINTLVMTYNTDVPINASFSVAQSFFVGNTRRITSITLNLYQFGDSPDGDYTVALYSDSAGRPGAPISALGSGPANSLSSDFEAQLTFTGLNIVVTANRSYFVVVTSTGGAFIGWGNTSDCGSVCSMGFPSYYSENTGTGWSDGVQTLPLRLNAEGEQIACNWTAGAGTSTWSTAANWDCGLAPVTGDTATVGSASPSPVITSNAALNALTVSTGGSVVVVPGVTLTGLTSISVASGASFSFSGAPGNIRAASVTNNGTITQVQDVPFGATANFAIRDPNNIQDTYPMLQMTPNTTGLGAVTLQVRGNQACSTVDSTAHRCFDIRATSPQAATLRFWYLNSEKAAQLVASMAAYHADPVLGWQALTLASTPRGTNGLWEWVEAVNVSSYSPFVLANSTPTAVSLLDLKARPAGQNITWALGGALALAGLGLLLRRKLAR